MTNEELLEWIANGDEAALTKLCLANTGLVKNRAWSIARQYHCLRQTKYGGLSDYAKETLSVAVRKAFSTIFSCNSGVISP